MGNTDKEPDAYNKAEEDKTVGEASTGTAYDDSVV